MTKRHINTFSGGIDRDTSVNKYDNTHYYDAENVRPISNDTFSNGAITNVGGLLDKIDFSEVNYTNLDPDASITNLSILKAINIRNTLVLFGICQFTAPEVSYNTFTYDGLEYGEVKNPETGRIWLDRNLGATRVATSIDDSEAYGDLYQWGRGNDGHEKRTSDNHDGDADGKPSTYDESGDWDGKFIITDEDPNDWLDPQDDSLWQGVGGINVPDIPGYRLPTKDEWEEEHLTWSSDNYHGAIDSPLKLPAAGDRYISGNLRNEGTYGNYWASTVEDVHADSLTFVETNAFTGTSDDRACGKSVRLIKDTDDSDSIPYSNIILTVDLVDNNFSDVNIVKIYEDTNIDNTTDFHSNISVVGKHESDSIQKIYWADGKNPLRLLNIKNYPDNIDSAIFNDTNPSELDHVPDVEFNESISISQEIGGNYKTGVVYYAYQLYNKNGTITTISPIIGYQKLTSISSDVVGGSDFDDDINKSVKVSIEDLDTRYDRIRVLSIFYQELYQNPSIGVVYDGINIGSVDTIDTGNPIDNITYEEFLVFNNTTYIPSNLEAKNNILFAANIKEGTFQSDAIDNWDSRAYTFTENSTSFYIRNFDESDTNYDNYSDVPEDHDCISPGALFNSNNVSKDEKYQYDSSTLGGEGENIKYTFSRYDKIIDLYGDNETKYDITPLKSTIAGLQPNEVYRFGIVFYNKKGQVSHVKWINDIRIPFVEDISGELFYYKDSSSEIQGAVVQVEFEIKNFPSDSNINSWQIVRCRRNREDREVLYNGLFLGTDIRPGHDETFVRPYIENPGDMDSDGTYTCGKYLSYRHFDSDGTDFDPVYLWEFLSPDINFNSDIANLENAKAIITNYISYEPEHEEAGDSVHSFFVSKYRESDSWPEVFSKADIKDYAKVLPTTFQVEEIITLGNSDKERFFNQTRPGLVNSPDLTDNIGIGGTKLVLNSDLFVDSGNDFPLDWETWENEGGDYSFRSLYGQLVQDVSYTRYGGVTYEARKTNEYIPYSKVIPSYTSKDEFSLNNNGDVYVNMFSYLRNIFQYDYPDDWDSKEGIQELISFPVQSSINVDYRSDQINRFISKPDEYLFDSTRGEPKAIMLQETVQKGIEYQPDYYDKSIGDLYTYNSIYSKQNDVKKFYPKPLDLVEQSVIDNKILASEKKNTGESIDSWSIFKANNFIEVESDYGPITQLKRFKNQLYCFQPDAIALIAVNDRSLISDDSGLQLALGTGGVLERYDYISTSTGLQRPSALIASKEALYYIDEYSKEFRMLAGPNSQDLSRIKGFYSKLNELLPSDKITTGFDPKFNEIYLNFDNETWVYNEIIQSVVGKFSTDSDNYFDLNGNLYSSKDNIIRLHNDSNSKLGDKSYITLLINPNSNIINSFDNLDFRTSTDLQNNESYIRVIKVEYITADGSNYSTGINLYDYDDETMYTYEEVSGSDDKEIKIYYLSEENYNSGEGSEKKLFKPKYIDIITNRELLDFRVSVSTDDNIYFTIYESDSLTDSIEIDTDSILPTLDLKEYGYGSVSRIKYENSYINPITVDVNLDGNNKNVSYLARAYRTQVPQTSEGNRFVDSYILVTFEYDNKDDLNFKLHDVITYYRETKM